MQRNDSTTWWRNSAIYQVYIRSFADGNGDGTGDLAGLRSRLPYLVELGVDAIWVNPWYPSPLVDGGYDVSDYRAIHPDFGTLAEAEALIDECHAAGIRVIADLVPNHCSDAHEWFRQALAAGPGSPERARFHFRTGAGPAGDVPPSNWRSVFGGSAWTRVDDGEWYLHLFDPSQPDLNWENPDVHAEFDSILRFWLDRGIDGFRIDVAHGLVKDMSYPDVEHATGLLSNPRVRNHAHWDRDGVHEIIRRWRAILDGYDGRMMVAEAWVRPDSLPLYLRPDEYHQSFSFDLLDAPWTPAGWAGPIQECYDAVSAAGATATWVLSNHDVMRHATRLGLPDGTDWRLWPVTGPFDALDVDAGRRRARAALLVTLGLPGVAYLYQGEELGLPEVWDLPTEVLDDPVWVRSGGKQKGRDGCRVPLPWTADGPSFGFGTGAPWLPQPDSFGAHAASAQADDPTSTLALYRNALRVRREHLIDDERLTMLDLGAGVFGFQRGNGVRCLVNMGDTDRALGEGEVLLASQELTDRMLPPDGAVWIR